MITLLIIDDEIKLRETVSELLSYAGYEVIEAADGKEGLAKVKEFKPDLILCDLMMPILDGYGFMGEHQISNYSQIPVIFLTAKMDLTDKEIGLALGVKTYFEKPFVFKELKKVIEYYLVQKD